MADRGLFDMHCHIVPAVDDGAQSVKEAFAMLQMEYDQGVRKIIVTPHFRREMFGDYQKAFSGIETTGGKDRTRSQSVPRM